MEVSMATAQLAAPARKPHRRTELRWGLTFLSPWLLGFVLFTAGPMVASLVLSFTRYDMISDPAYVGTENYQRLLDDPKILKALVNTVVYAALHVPLSILLALGLAALMRRAGRASGPLRTMLYLPVMTPPVAMAALFFLLLNGERGLVNAVLGGFGVDGPNWTTDPTWIKPGLVVMSLWTVGSTAVLYLAAMAGVPRHLYEAAQMDGAGAWRQFRHVTLPLISPTIYFTVVVNTIASLQFFTEAYAMFYTPGTSSSADGDAALFYVIYLFQQAFTFLHMGYASAMAWLLFAVIALVTIVQVRASRRLVHYEGD
jgi:multiple sugar transport system permease protein